MCRRLVRDLRNLPQFMEQTKMASAPYDVPETPTSPRTAESKSVVDHVATPLGQGGGQKRNDLRLWQPLPITNSGDKLVNHLVETKLVYYCVVLRVLA